MRPAPSNLLRCLAAALIAGIFATGLVACGGGGDSDSSSADDQITAVITDAIEADDETLCTGAFSTGFVEEITGQKGQEAIDTCEKQLKADNSDNGEVKVTNIKVEGDKATADVTFEADTGGKKESQSAKFDLVTEDGEWRIDGVH